MARSRITRPEGSLARENIPKALPRADGELYDRPEPDPFTQSWNNGYDDAVNSWASTPTGDKRNQERYLDGYQAGLEQRKELDDTASSNT
jgi:hypothetical protein